MRYQNAPDLNARREIAERRARFYRWNAKGKSRVIHPRYGDLIVPHSSYLGAILCACEVWGVSFSAISADVEVWACDQSLPAVKMPGTERSAE